MDPNVISSFSDPDITDSPKLQDLTPEVKRRRDSELWTAWLETYEETLAEQRDKAIERWVYGRRKADRRAGAATEGRRWKLKYTAGNLV